MADATPLIDSWIDNAENTKQGRKFFGCCCDSRRAVIVISVWVVNQIWNVTLILGAVYYSDIIAIMGVLWQLFKLMSDIYIFVAYYATWGQEERKRTKEEKDILAVAPDYASTIAARLAPQFAKIM
eukprot:scaffold6156_cov132-Skeletonema_dohrnii-CCMP3373.AAC.1